MPVLVFVGLWLGGLAFVLFGAFVARRSRRD